MKDGNGIESKCENCRNTIFGPRCYFCKGYDKFLPTDESYEARIADLQNELYVVQESARVEAQEADRLREEVKELKAHNEVLQKRIEEFSMELLDRIMRDNKDVLVRLKQAEREENNQ